MDDLILTADDALATIDVEHGGRLAALRVGQDELLGAGGDGQVGWGCFPMVPFAGRIRHGLLRWQGIEHQLELGMPPHAIHGVGYDRPWRVLDASTHCARLSCEFDQRWPWAGHAEQLIELAGNRLTARLEVHARDTAMPAWIGYHPWFRRRLGRGEPVRLEIPASGILPRDDDGMPSPDRVPVPPQPWDDVFTEVAWPAAVVWDGAIRLEISADHPWGVVFTEREAAVCVEPQTGPPNAAELGLADTVTPGSPLALTMTWTWTQL